VIYEGNSKIAPPPILEAKVEAPSADRRVETVEIAC
jgi:hypothetical protein